MLSHNIAFYLPSKDRHGQDVPMVDRLQAAAYVRHKLLDKYNGCTEYDARGHWNGPDGEQTGESVLIIRSFCDKSPSVGWCEHIAAYLKRKLSQDSVAYEINGCLMFFEKNGNFPG